MAIETVTSETLAEFNAARTPQKTPEPEAKEETKAEEVKAEPDAEKVDGEVVEPAKTEPEPKKNKLESRFSEITEARRKAEERATAAEARAAELEAKLKPADTAVAANDDGIGPEPLPKDYTDAFEYARDLAKWSTDKALKDRDEADAKKVQEKQRATIIDAWKDRVDAVKAVRPDWEDLVASSKAAVSDPARDTMIESEYGPHILGDLAADDDLAEKVSKMKPADQVKWIGKMEAKYEAEAAIAEAKDEKTEKTEVIIRERPKAPAPITPVRGTRATESPVETPGEFTGSFKEWKAARLRQMK